MIILNAVSKRLVYFLNIVFRCSGQRERTDLFDNILILIQKFSDIRGIISFLQEIADASDQTLSVAFLIYCPHMLLFVIFFQNHTCHLRSVSGEKLRQDIPGNTFIDSAPHCRCPRQAFPQTPTDRIKPACFSAGIPKG